MAEREVELTITGGRIDDLAEGARTQEELVHMFEHLLTMQKRKSLLYADAWREQGYVGNVARVLSKASRLRNMVFRDVEIEDTRESVADTLGDLCLLAAFALINWKAGNRWGR